MTRVSRSTFHSLFPSTKSPPVAHRPNRRARAGRPLLPEWLGAGGRDASRATGAGASGAPGAGAGSDERRRSFTERGRWTPRPYMVRLGLSASSGSGGAEAPSGSFPTKPNLVVPAIAPLTRVSQDGGGAKQGWFWLPAL